MIIYNPQGAELLDVLVDDRSYRLQEIMNENVLMLYFALSQFVEIPEGSYVIYKAKQYHLSRSQNFKMINSRNFEYSLLLHSDEVKADDVLFKFDNDLKYSLTLTPVEFQQLIIDNLNDSETGWTAGSCITADPITIDFSEDTCKSALVKICSKFNTEYEFDSKVLNIGKVEKEKDNPISLSYGYNQGILSGLTRTQFDDSKVINRLRVSTSDRNVDKSVYGSRVLKMPKNHTITYNGVQYRTDATGSYVERVGRTGRVVEAAIDLTQFFPTRLGTVSWVYPVDTAKYLYDIADFTIPIELDFNACLIAGQTMTLIFQTGLMAGKEFEVKYIHNDRRFELKPITENGEIFPAGSLVPEVGDKYRVFNISLPEQYYTEASEKVLNAAVAFLAESEQPRYTYKWQLDGLYAKRNWLEIGGYLQPGYFVSFSDPRFQQDPVNIRIISVKEFLNKPKSPVIEIANNISGKSLGSELKKIPEKEQGGDRKLKDVVRYNQRRWVDALESISMIEAAIDGFSDSIDPVSIQTMSILAGKEELQIEFVSNKTTPVTIAPEIYFNAPTKQIICSASIIRHMTLGIKKLSSSHSASEYRYWDISSYQSPVLDVASKKYYLYLRCTKSTVSPFGTFVLSETPLSFDADATWYHFLIFTVGSEREGARSLFRLYGFSEFGPGRVVTDMISSPSGLTYMNLVAGNGAGEFGGIFKFAAGSQGLYNLLEWEDIEDALAQAMDNADEALSAAAALAYLKNAILEGDTTIAGGLVLTNLLMLKGVDNVIRAGMSGLANDNIFLFADTVNAYQKALAGTAQFILRKDGTAKLSIMRINADTVGLYAGSKEILQFRTGNIPALADLVSTLDTTINYTGGNDTFSGLKESNFGMSNVMLVDSIESFNLSVAGTLLVRAENDEQTPIPNSYIELTLKLYKLVSGSYVYDRDIEAVAVISDMPGNTQESKTIDAAIALPAGSYKIQAEYMINTVATDQGYVDASGISMRARGAAAQQCTIFGANGFARITDGYNYDYFSDTIAKFSRGENKHLLLDDTKTQIKGTFDAPGLLAAGSVTSGGGLNNSIGKVTQSERLSTGLYMVTHSVGHTNYAVNLTLFNTGAQLTAVITNKANTSFSVRIVNPSNNNLVDSSFDFSIYGNN